MLKKILVPVDFSDHTEKSLEYLLQLSPCGLEEVQLLHVIDTRVLTDSAMMFEEALDEEYFLASCKKNATAKLEKISRELSGEGFKVSFEILEGVPFSVILKEARHPDISLILLGHKGHNLADELLMGSTAEKVVRKSSKAVLLTR